MPHISKLLGACQNNQMVRRSLMDLQAVKACPKWYGFWYVRWPRAYGFNAVGFGDDGSLLQEAGVSIGMVEGNAWAWRLSNQLEGKRYSTIKSTKELTWFTLRGVNDQIFSMTAYRVGTVMLTCLVQMYEAHRVGGKVVLKPSRGPLSPIGTCTLETPFSSSTFLMKGSATKPPPAWISNKERETRALAVEKAQAADGYGYVAWIAVKDWYRGQGLGKVLYRAATKASLMAEYKGLVSEGASRNSYSNRMWPKQQKEKPFAYRTKQFDLGARN